MARAWEFGYKGTTGGSLPEGTSYVKTRIHAGDNTVYKLTHAKKNR